MHAVTLLKTLGREWDHLGLCWDQGYRLCMCHLLRVWGYFCLNEKNGWPLVFLWNVPPIHSSTLIRLHFISCLSYNTSHHLQYPPLHSTQHTINITCYFLKAQIQSAHFPTWCFFHSAVSTPQCINQDLYQSKFPLISKPSLLGSHPHWLQLPKAPCSFSPLCLCPWYFPCLTTFSSGPPNKFPLFLQSPIKWQCFHLWSFSQVPRVSHRSIRATRYFWKYFYILYWFKWPPGDRNHIPQTQTRFPLSHSQVLVAWVFNK